MNNEFPAWQNKSGQMLSWLGPFPVVASDLQYKSIMDCPYLTHVVAPYAFSQYRHQTLVPCSLLLSSPPVVGTSPPSLQVLETSSPCCMQQTSIPVKTLIRQPINKEQPESSSNECGRQHSSLIALPTLAHHRLDLLISLPAALFNLSQPATECCLQPAALLIA